MRNKKEWKRFCHRASALISWVSMSLWLKLFYGKNCIGRILHRGLIPGCAGVFDFGRSHNPIPPSPLSTGHPKKFRLVSASHGNQVFWSQTVNSWHLNVTGTARLGLYGIRKSLPMLLFTPINECSILPLKRNFKWTFNLNSQLWCISIKKELPNITI